MPLGASVMKATIERPTSIRLKADEMVTMAVCCTMVSSTAPITGPIQVLVPADQRHGDGVHGIGEIERRRRVEIGDVERQGAPAMPISAPDSTVTSSFSRRVGTP